MEKGLQTKIPIGLIYSRLVLGPVIILLSIYQSHNFRYIIVGIMVWAIISDIFDGIIARKLNISTQKLRRLDSSIDQIFWICTLIGAFLLCKNFFIDNYIKLVVVIFFEALTYLISFVKFRKEVATHAILSKLWALTILATLIEVILTNSSNLLFNICFYTGILTRIEIIAILVIIKEWTNDVPSLYHAFLLRQGKEIKRNKLFNG